MYYILVPYFHTWRYDIIVCNAILSHQVALFNSLKCHTFTPDGAMNYNSDKCLT